MTPARRMLVLTDIFGGVHGGTEGQLVALLERLPASWEAELWVLQDSEYLGHHPFPCPWRQLHLPRMRHPMFLPRLRSVATAIRGAGFDLIHALHADTCTLAPVLGRWAGVPVLTSRRDLGYWQTPRRIESLRRANRHVAGILANSEAVARRTIDVEYAHPARVHVVRNGHDPARFEAAPHPTLRRDLGIPEDAPLVGLVANFRPLKRQRDLVDALALLTDHSDAHVLFVGTGRGADATLAHAKALGLEGRVHVQGVTGDVVPVVRHLSVGVLCSESEGLSNAIIEYLACGLPVVATNVGGNPELVTPRINGFLYEVGDIEGLASHLGVLLADAERAQAFGAASEERFAAELTIDRMVDQTCALYERVLAPAPSSDEYTWSVEHDLGALEALASDWQALCTPNQFFAGPNWVLTWLRWSGAAPRVLVARDRSGALAAVLPLAQQRRGVWAFAGQRMGADHLDLVARSSARGVLAAGVLSYLATLPWRRVDLWHMAEDGALRAALHDPRRAVPFEERATTICPYIETLGRTWDEYLATMFSRKRRHELRRTMRRFFEQPGARVEAVEKAADVASSIDRLFALHAARFRVQGKSTVFRGERLNAFHRALAERLLRDDELFLSFLRTDEGELAAYYGFRFGNKLYHFQSGMAPVDRGTSPGTILRNHTLAHDVFGRGLSEFDFLDGDESYKFQWATGQRRLFDITLRPRTVRGAAGHVASILKGLVKFEARRLRAEAD